MTIEVGEVVLADTNVLLSATDRSREHHEEALHNVDQFSRPPTVFCDEPESVAARLREHRGPRPERQAETAGTVVIEDALGGASQAGRERK